MDRYVDQEAFNSFNDFDGQLIHAHILLPVHTTKAYDTFLHHIWCGQELNATPLALAVPTILHPGEGQGKLQSVRKMPLGIIEKITSVGLPMNNKIASVSYKVVQGPFPAEQHMGMVSFIQESENSTLIVWEAKFIPNTFASVFCCGGTIVRAIARSYFQQALQTLQLKLQSSKIANQ